MLNRSYSRFQVSASAYYPRFFSALEIPRGRKKRKRKEKRKMKALNERELVAEQRHQEKRSILLRAHEALLGDQRILDIIKNLRNETSLAQEIFHANEVSLLDLCQSPFYHITLSFDHHFHRNGDPSIVRHCQKSSVLLFNNMVANETNREGEAEFLDNKYIIPRQSCFYMSDLEHMHNLIPAKSDCGYNLIVIDPPWENSSARQKHRYQTLPNRYFLSIPVKQLTHSAGALVALWVTNREKLRSFVENELFSAWGVKHVANFFWLKVKADGSLISDMDLFHHRPYECLILGYCGVKDTEVSTLKSIPDNKVFVSVPGEYSRKPPLGELLKEYTPGLDSACCIELFAREMISGWTSWGNEPLHFQNSKYFLHKSLQEGGPK
ncbi:hypothetical protein Leryth_014572 [Lithospermum erythrorhizon]|nr:hypothetical protein Leryth_014572 [Lithospermum erythrorhizon]